MEIGIGAEGPREALAQQEQENPAGPAEMSAQIPANPLLLLYPVSFDPSQGGDPLSGITSRVEGRRL